MSNKLLEKYDNKVIRSLIQLIPFGIGSAADVFLKETIDEIQNDRLKTFFNNLSDGIEELTEEELKSEDFLHNYFSTIRIVSNTRRREKISIIGKLFNNSVNTGIVYYDDGNYEKYLKILDELSFFELGILKELYSLEIKNGSDKEFDKGSKLRNNQKFWHIFLNKMENEFEITRDGLDEILIRIERTGCLYIPRISATDRSPYCAITTILFSELLDLLSE